MVQYENEGIEVEYIYQTPWTLLFGKNGIRKALVSFGEAFLILILMFSSCGSTEKEGVQLIIQASPAGKRGVITRKIYICIVTSIITAGLAFFPEFVNIIKTYGLNDFNAPSCSFFSFGCNAIKSSMNMGTYLISQIVLRILSVIIAGLIFVGISQKTKSRILTILLGLILLLLLPVLFVILNPY